MIIIDTDVLIEVADKISKKGDQIYEKIKSTEDDVAITSITMYEALYGLMKYSRPFQQLFLFRVFDFSNEDAQEAARLEINLENRGKKIKRTDIMIASTAINKGAYLYTFDKDFQALMEFGLRLIN
ncbi:MAG TPA: type II toxin-antitoxin system VapC family toxin [Nitrososphaeraceae archaeon]